MLLDGGDLLSIVQTGIAKVDLIVERYILLLEKLLVYLRNVLREDLSVGVWILYLVNLFHLDLVIGS